MSCSSFLTGDSPLIISPVGSAISPSSSQNNFSSILGSPSLPPHYKGGVLRWYLPNQCVTTSFNDLTLTSRRGWETNLQDHQDTFLKPNREQTLHLSATSSTLSSPLSSFNHSLTSGAACFPFSFTINNSLFSRPQLFYSHHILIHHDPTSLHLKRIHVCTLTRSSAIRLQSHDKNKKSGLTRAFHSHDNGQKAYGKIET